MATILHMMNYGGPYSGNFISSLLFLEEKVSKERGINSIFIFPERAKKRAWLTLIQRRKIPIFFIDKKMTLLKRIKNIITITKDYNVILVHSHFTAFDLDAVFVAKYLKAKVIWHERSIFFEKFTVKQRLKDLIKIRFIANNWVDSVVTVSDSVSELMKQRGIMPSKIIIINNGIDIKKFWGINKKKKAILSRKYNILKNQKVFLLFGWSPHTKGVDLFVNASKILWDLGYTNILCLIVYGEKSKDIICEMIADIPWVRAIQPIENIVELYNISDCFVSASRTEGFSNSIGEAMISKLPVVSSNLPHLIRIFEPTGKGFITFKNEDVQDLVVNLERILKTSSKELCEMGNLNYQYIKKNYTIDKWCKKIIDLYDFLLNKRY